MDKQSAKGDIAQIVSEELVVEAAGPMMDESVTTLCRYVNGVAGDMVISASDSEVRRILLALLMTYEESRNASS